MKARVFNGGDVVEFCNVWRQNANVFPNLYRSADYGTLEAFLFGSKFFDLNNVLVAVRDANPSQPLGFVFYSFAPDKTRAELDPNVGVLYAPLLSTNLSQNEKREAEDLLIVEAENRLRAQGTTLVFAGGRPDGAPLLGGLYSPSSPSGLYKNDPNAAIFERNGYVFDAVQNEYRVDLEQYRVPDDREFREAQNIYLEPVADFWRSRANWFDVNVYAHFTSRQWLTRLPDVGILSGAITHSLNAPFSTLGGEPRPATVLGFFAVNRNFVRRRAGSVLLASVVKGLNQLNCGGDLCVVVPENDRAFCQFFESNSFELAARFISRVKSL